ncbi:MAG: hypothetical protein OIF38_11910, partial [Cellvibrionaceae bacterium]|nr:hypothetical protein [Cellvibrionaceae bacterium]
MNFVKRALLLTMVFLFFIEAQAQSVVELQQQLQQLQRQPAAIIDKLDPQEEEVVAYGRKLELARDDLGQAERDAEDAKKAASEALKQHKASTSQESERAMRLADHGYKMARRGVANRGKRVDRIESRYQQAILDQQKLVAKLRQAEADIRFVRVKLAKAQLQERQRERQAAASRTPQ